jgi:DNA-binding CsgD family transcriptional regulator
MNTEIRKTLSPEEFVVKIRTEQSADKIDFRAYFDSAIQNAINYAVGPYFWFIPDNATPQIIAVSPNISLMTPFDEFQWLDTKNNANLFANNIHPDDRFYLLSAIQIAMENATQFQIMGRKQAKFNLYARFLDAQGKYSWKLIQFPSLYFNEENQVESLLVMVTDLSHLGQVHQPMMTIIDNENQENQYFNVIIGNKKLIPIELPRITKREQEIMCLMARGMTTPKIANELNIAYNTVENHKRNLREKTQTKTSAELMNFMIKNNLL